jgi:GTPase
LSIVEGMLLGLKPSQRKQLEYLALKRIPAAQVLTHDLSRRLTQLSCEIGRQIGIFIDRKGKIQKVIVGDARSIDVPKLHGWRVGTGRLRGLRLLHTHLKGEPLSLEDLTDLAMLRLDLVACIGLDNAGFPTLVTIGHLLPQNPAGQVWQLLDPVAPSQLDLDFTAFVKSLEDEISRSVSSASSTIGREKAYLVGKTSGADWKIEESLKELVQLAYSAGLDVVGSTIQKRDSADHHFVVGKGKLREIIIDAQQKGASVMLFDLELTPAQVRAIVDFTELKVIDRSQLILDIFAQRAKSRDGKIQVELAQLKYALPRLGEKDDALSRLTGGIGGRGPGETRLEINRRRIHSRIGFLEKQIRQLASRRNLRRGLRSRRNVPVISIVGYTNVGKSTLLNNLTKSNIIAADKLFATLDPCSRRLRFPRETEVIITDTVGFLQDLPETLVAAFSATLDELADADLLLHVIDCSNPLFENQMTAVEKLLEKLDLNMIPVIRVFNKTDLVMAETADNICNLYRGVGISAVNSKTFRPLIERMENEILDLRSRKRDYDFEATLIESSMAN